MFERAIIEAGGRLYEVGGSVRDKLLKRERKDKDYLVTGIPLEKLQVILKRFGKVAFVGKSFGVLKLFGGGQECDFAIPRKEVSTGVGHREFDVTYDHTMPVELDLARRDFTKSSCDQRLWIRGYPVLVKIGEPVRQARVFDRDVNRAGLRPYSWTVWG